MSVKFENILKEKFNSGELESIVKDSLSLTAVLNKLGYKHPRNNSEINKFCRTNNISISHFTTNGLPTPYEIERKCPECGSLFYVHSAGKQATTCSNTCGNRYFAYKQGTKNKKSGIGVYVETLRSFYRKINRDIKCCCCDERTILDVHHLDEDRANNSIDNLIFLCPTHHMYLHRKGMSTVFDDIVKELDARVT